MKIFGICLVKNEADIIEYCLEEASKWATKIFVYDNGSEDETWEIVQDIAKHNSIVIPFKQEALPFRDNLRAKVFNNYKHLAKNGDWWCFRMDSDEFYIDDPRIFLSKVSSRYHVVCKASYDYRLTFEDIDEYEFKDSCPHDAIQLKYYNPLIYTEKRFFRHRNRLVWREKDSFPIHMGLIAPQLIKLKHLQYRSPNQIQSRLDKKKIATKSGFQFFKKHDSEDHWKEVLEYRKNLIKENGSWQYDGLKYPDLYKKSWKRDLFERIMFGLKIYP